MNNVYVDLEGRTQPRRHLPGGPFALRPYEAERGGTWHLTDGTPLTLDERDKAFSEWFWATHQTPGLREAMEKNLHSSAKTRQYSLFVDLRRITDFDRAKLSAYRVLAGELGYELGHFEYHEDSVSAVATIRKK